MAGVNLDNALMPGAVCDEFDVKLCSAGIDRDVESRECVIITRII